MFSEKYNNSMDDLLNELEENYPEITNFAIGPETYDLISKNIQKKTKQNLFYCKQSSSWYKSGVNVHHYLNFTTLA